MSTNRSRRIDHDTAEQLLGGVGVGSEAGQASLTGQQALAELLAATAVRADDGPLPGEEQAVAAFREARRTSAATTARPAQHRRRTMADTALARAFSAKAMAVAFAATALGGVAVAASTGNFPVLGGPADDRPTASAGPGHASASGQTAGGTSGNPAVRGGQQPGGTARPSGNPDGATADVGSRPSDGSTPASVPDLAKLCRSFTDQVAGGGKAREVLAQPTLKPLVDVAGGVEKVTGYCAAGKADPGPSATKDNKNTPTPTPSPTKSDKGKASADPSTGNHGTSPGGAAGGTEG